MARTKQFDQEKVLEKAMNLFWEKGYHDTSMQDLIDGLGINRASLYDTFGSKKELYDLALNKYIDQNEKVIAGFLYYQTNIRQGLYLLFERMIDDALNDNKPRGCFTVSAISELAASDEKVYQRASKNRLITEEIYINYLQYGVNHSQVSPYKDLKAISSYLISLQNGIKLLSKIQPNKEELLKIVSTGLAVLD